MNFQIIDQILNSRHDLSAVFCGRTYIYNIALFKFDLEGKKRTVTSMRHHRRTYIELWSTPAQCARSMSCWDKYVAMLGSIYLSLRESSFSPRASLLHFPDKSHFPHSIVRPKNIGVPPCFKGCVVYPFLARLRGAVNLKIFSSPSREDEDEF